MGLLGKPTRNMKINPVLLYRKEILLEKTKPRKPSVLNEEEALQTAYDIDPNYFKSIGNFNDWKVIPPNP